MRKNTSNQDRFAKRRFRSVVLTFSLLVMFSIFCWYQSQSLGRNTFVTGYVLIGSLFFLAAFNIRKKLSFLPQLGSASMWMQVHIYVGLSTFVIFAWHINWTIPQGGFEQLLAAVYLFVALSGVYGLYITRTIPKKLTQLPTEPIFESIPHLRNRIARQAKSLIENNSLQNEVLRKLYNQKLSSFFGGTRGLAYAVAPSSRFARNLVAEIRKQDRYLSDDDRKLSKELAQLVRERDDLDYHLAMQGRLKSWLIIHIGFTYSLLIISVVHGIMAHAFAGGIR